MEQERLEHFKVLLNHKLEELLPGELRAGVLKAFSRGPQLGLLSQDPLPKRTGRDRPVDPIGERLLCPLVRRVSKRQGGELEEDLVELAIVLGDETIHLVFGHTQEILEETLPVFEEVTSGVGVAV